MKKRLRQIFKGKIDKKLENVDIWINLFEKKIPLKATKNRKLHGDEDVRVAEVGSLKIVKFKN